MSFTWAGFSAGAALEEYNSALVMWLGATGRVG
jgi:hypothetical protein